MKRFSFLFFLSFLIIACRSKDPANASYAIPEAQVTLGGLVASRLAGVHLPDSSRLNRKSQVMAKIATLQQQAAELKEGQGLVDTEAFDHAWSAVRNEVTANIDNLSDEDIVKWVLLNDSLLKYSGEQRFAEELERMVYNTPVPEVITGKMIKSFCYTRLYDRIYVNLLGGSAMEYDHTTGGRIRLVQETKYPFDGRITFKVEMDDTRYLDLFIRIPGWCEQSSVTLKGVMYNTVAGNYTEIARKWKNGDVVEVVLGFRPDVIQKDSAAIAFTFGPLFLSYPAQPGNATGFQNEDPIKYLKLVSAPGEMPTFTFNGFPDTTLVLQPFFAGQDPALKRTTWMNTGTR